MKKKDTAEAVDLALQFPLAGADAVTESCDDLVPKFGELFDGKCFEIHVGLLYSEGPLKVENSKGKRVRTAAEQSARNVCPLVPFAAIC